MLDHILKLIKNNRGIHLLGTLIAVLAVVLIALNMRSGSKTSSQRKTEALAAGNEASSLNEMVSGHDTGGELIDSLPSFVENLSGPEDASSVTAEPDSGPESAVLAPPAGEVSITVSAAGDCTLASDDSMSYDMSFFAKYDEVGDPSWFLSNVRDVFATDDLTIVNFEGTLASGGERADKTYAFRGKPEYVSILTEGSVEAADLANNHSFDYGPEAYEETKKILEDAGIVTFGYDRSRVIDIKGIKVGLVGIFELETEFECVYQMREQVQAVKDQGAQLIIVCFHWGNEGMYETSEVQIELAREAVLAGANLVLGHHPHRIQGIDCYEGVYICYSLGNFCFGGHSGPDDMDSMIFRQTFTFVDGVLQDMDEHLVIPCRISSAEDYNNYRPTILEDEEGSRVLQKIRDLF